MEKAAKAPGRKGQLARWQLNMRRGKKESVEELSQLNDSDEQANRLIMIDQHEEGGDLEGYVTSTSAPQLMNYLESQGANLQLAKSIAAKFSKIAIIKNMYVDEESRGHNIGSNMLEAAIDDAFSNGAEAIVLVADMSEDNQAMGKTLDKWYEGWGFRKIGMAGSDPVMILNKNANESLEETLKQIKGKFKAGDILMASSWKAPATNFARGNVLEGRYKARWTGVH